MKSIIKPLMMTKIIKRYFTTEKLLWFFIFFLFTFFSSYARSSRDISEDEARIYLNDYLQEKYQEDFIIGEFSRGEVHFEADVILKRYLGTPKENDEYYFVNMAVMLTRTSRGFEIDSVRREHYDIIITSEEANKYILPKLNSIFGKEIRPFIHLNIYRWKKGEDIINSLKNQGISGDIFIFDRINDAQKEEEYQNKIKELASYLQDEEFFSESKLGIYIIDERILSEKFETEVASKLKEASVRIDNSDEFLSYREELFDDLNESYENMSEEEKIQKIYQLKRSFYKSDYIKYSTIFHHIIYNQLRKDRVYYYTNPNYRDSKSIRIYNTIEVIYEERKPSGIYTKPWENSR